MPPLASMRSIDPAETFQPLGPATRPAPPAASVPTSKPTGTPGIVQLPDGKLATNLPPPPKLASYEWELDAAAAGGKLATQLPLPGSKPAVKVHDSICEFPSYYTEAAQRLSGSLRPNASGEAPRETRQAQVGDWVRVLSGQNGIPEIEAMIGGVFQLTGAGSSYVQIGNWSFKPPGIVRDDGQLMTEFVEAPK